MSLASYPLNDLAQQCAEQTQLFSRRLRDDPRYCFELLRRALAESVPEAFNHVWQIYLPQVVRWVHRHAKFPRTGESAEYFANAALASFYFALRGPRFAALPSLANALAYLKACVHSAIAQYVRDQQKAEWVPEDENIHTQPNLSANVDADELWAHLCRLLPHEVDQRLAYAVFVLDLRPREIVLALPGLWRDERHISVELFRIRRILRRDRELRQLLGLPPDADA
jgi:hypothetical protein